MSLPFLICLVPEHHPQTTECQRHTPSGGPHGTLSQKKKNCAVVDEERLISV